MLSMLQVFIYTNQQNHNIEELKSLLEKFADRYPHIISIIDISQDKYLTETCGEKVPFVEIGPYRLVNKIDEADIEFALRETAQKVEIARGKGNQVVLERFTQLPKITKSDRFSYWFSKHYMMLFNLALVLYVGMAFLAPVFMKVGLPKPANVIYSIFKPLCHQLTYRSFFLFGEQIVYPREIAHVNGLVTYEEATGFPENDINLARSFIGNEQMGYKVALCQRDVAIYLAILIFGVIFSVTKQKLRPVPWYLWLILGVVPIGLDGFSQLLSQIGLSILSWLPYRESTPLLRTLTGALFGLFTAWYGYPFVEESVAESRGQMAHKLAVVKVLDRNQEIQIEN